MPDLPKPRLSLQTGPLRDIAYAQAADGSRPAKIFYEALTTRNQMAFANLFIQTTEHGEISNPIKFRPKVSSFSCDVGDIKRAGNIAEFKIHNGSGQRILAYRDGRLWVLVSGFTKGAVLSAEIKKAQHIICEDLRRQSPQKN